MAVTEACSHIHTHPPFLPCGAVVWLHEFAEETTHTDTRNHTQYYLFVASPAREAAWHTYENNVPNPTCRLAVAPHNMQPAQSRAAPKDRATMRNQSSTKLLVDNSAGKSLSCLWLKAACSRVACCRLRPKKCPGCATLSTVKCCASLVRQSWCLHGAMRLCHHTSKSRW